MKNSKILVVDDAFFMRNLLGDLVKKAGYSDVYYAEDGFKAVEKSSEIKPDLITLDISMPGMDGLEAISKILEVSPQSKIIIVSAVTDQITIKMAIKSGAVDFLKKPVSGIEIEDMLDRHLR